MPPNLRRFMPIVLIAALAIFIVPTLLKKHNSGPSSSAKATQTIEAMNLIDRGERDYRTAHSRFTPHLADLLTPGSQLAKDLAIGLDVKLDVGSDGQSFLAEVTSDTLSLVRGRSETKVTAQSCRIVKSGSGVNCPPLLK